MILCGKLDHPLSLEIVNLLTLFQTQPSWYAIMIKIYSQMSFFKEKKKNCSWWKLLHSTFLHWRSKLPCSKALNWNSESPGPNIGWRIFFINCRWGCKGGAPPHFPCPVLISNIVLKMLLQLCLLKRPQEGFRDALTTAAPFQPLPQGSAIERGFAKLLQKITGKWYHKTSRASL